MTIQTQLRNAINHAITKERTTVKLLSRKSGLAPSHISAFRNGHRELSLHALEQLLSAHGFRAELVPLRSPNRFD